MAWEADSQMVRTRGATGNLAVGEPEFLREIMKVCYPQHVNVDLAYPDINPEPELEFQLRKLFPDPDDNIVVTCGGKQGLHAALAALKIDGAPNVLQHQGPYWPTYPTLARMAGMGFQSTIDNDFFGVRVCTAPNNPDGRQAGDYDKPVRKFDIWDAAYAYRFYGWDGVIPPHRISVWSAGKMLGSVGLRVGWLVTKEKKLAEAARRFVEQSTSGVSVMSQLHVASSLAELQVRPYLFDEALTTLGYNRNNLSILMKYSDEFHIGSGMFAWFKVKDKKKFDKALKASGVKMVTGPACGGPEDFYRASLGLSNDKTSAAVGSLITHLENP